MNYLSKIMYLFKRNKEIATDTTSDAFVFLVAFLLNLGVLISTSENLDWDLCVHFEQLVCWECCR